jgi:hypothetical protein
MSEQAKILAEMQSLIMDILKSGAATPAQGDRLDALEELMLQQKCYEAVKNTECSYLGEEIANLFFNEMFTEAIEKMYVSKITPEDFFAFAEYHYEDEEDTEMFTSSFVEDVKKSYKLKDGN